MAFTENLSCNARENPAIFGDTIRNILFISGGVVGCRNLMSCCRRNESQQTFLSILHKVIEGIGAEQHSIHAVCMQIAI